MGAFTVAEAQSGLPDLIDRATRGEEVLITRDGLPIAELRVPSPTLDPAEIGSTTWLRQRTMATKPLGLTSVELMRQVYDDDA